MHFEEDLREWKGEEESDKEKFWGIVFIASRQSERKLVFSFHVIRLAYYS